MRSETDVRGNREPDLIRPVMFVVERHMPNVSTADLTMLHQALAFACGRLTARGEPVACLGSAFLPGPARLLTLFEADSAGAVRTANESIHAPFLSLERALRIEPGPGPTPPSERAESASRSRAC